MAPSDLAQKILKSPEFRRYFERAIAKKKSLRGKTSADDLLQDLYVAVDRSEHIPRGEEFVPWAMTIAKRLISHRVRRARAECQALAVRSQGAPRRAPTILIDVPADSPEADALAFEFGMEVLRIMNSRSMPDDQAQAFFWRHGFHWSIERIAANMRRTPEAVKALLKRAAAYIRRRLRARGWGGVNMMACHAR